MPTLEKNITPVEQVFNYQGNDVKIIVINDEPWFVAKYVCDVLNHANSRMAIAQLDDDEKGVSKVYTLGGKQDVAIISEAGLYTLVLRSNKPEAKAFKRWVTHEVLPQIRKTKSYFDPSQMTRLQILEMATEAEKGRLALEAQLQEASVKVEKYNALMTSKNAQTFLAAGKALGIGQNKLFDLLRKKGFLMANNLPYQRYITNGYFEVKESTYKQGENNYIHAQTLITPKGLEMVHELVNQ